MEEILYLEADEEITSVVDKLKGLEADEIGLVIPKGSSIAQSLVSLRLLLKEAKRFSKRISIITSDEVGQNLAAQAGLQVFSDIRSRTPLQLDEKDMPENEPIKIDMTRGDDAQITSEAPLKPKDEATEKDVQEDADEIPKDFTVHRYDERADTKGEDEEQTTEADDAVQEKSRSLGRSPAGESRETGNEPSVHQNEQATSFSSHAIEEHKFRSDKPVDEVEAERPIREPEHIKKEMPKRNYRRAMIITACVFVGLVLLFLLFDLMVSTLTIKISTPAEEISREIELTVEKDRPAPDFDQNIIGGSQKSLEKSVEKVFKSTGEKDAGDKAKGTLTFKNEAGVDDTVAAGTSVTSTTNVEFTLDQQVVLPKAQLNSAGDKVLGQATAPVTAKNPGSLGNMNSSATYIVSGHSKVTALGGTTGGVTKKLKIVSKSDLDRAKEELKNQGESELFTQIGQNPDQIALEGAGVTEVATFESAKNVGDEAEEFSAKAQVKYTTIVFSQNDFRDAITKAIEKTLPQDKSLLLGSSDTVAPSLKEGNVNIGKLTIVGKLASHIGQKPDISGWSKTLRLKPIKKVKEIIESNKDITVEDVTLGPSIALPIAPILSSHIKINLEYSKK